MTTSANNAGERVRDVRVGDDVLVVDLMDGRTISVPTTWYPRLFQATPEERQNWQISGGALGSIGLISMKT